MIVADSILAFVEHADGRPERTSLEALVVARRLAAGGGRPHRGGPRRGRAPRRRTGLAPQGVAVAHLVEHPDLADYAPAAWAAAIQQLMDRRSPTAVVASGTDRGNEVMAYVGARTGLPTGRELPERRACRRPVGRSS